MSPIFSWCRIIRSLMPLAADASPIFTAAPH
jgi:hypothetical protein